MSLDATLKNETSYNLRATGHPSGMARESNSLHSELHVPRLALCASLFRDIAPRMLALLDQAFVPKRASSNLHSFCRCRGGTPLYPTLYDPRPTTDVVLVEDGKLPRSQALVWGGQGDDARRRPSVRHLQRARRAVRTMPNLTPQLQRFARS